MKKLISAILVCAMLSSFMLTGVAYAEVSNLQTALNSYVKTTVLYDNFKSESLSDNWEVMGLNSARIDWGAFSAESLSNAGGDIGGITKIKQTSSGSSNIAESQSGKYFNTTIEKTYLFEAQVRVPAGRFVTAAARAIGARTAELYASNGSFKLQFSIENDGIYAYANVNGSEQYTRIHETAIDSEYHTYSVITNDFGYAAMYMDGVSVGGFIMPNNIDISNVKAYSVRKYNADEVSYNDGSGKFYCSRISLYNLRTQKSYIDDISDGVSDAESITGMEIVNCSQLFGQTKKLARVTYDNSQSGENSNAEVVYKSPDSTGISGFKFSVAYNVAEVQTIATVQLSDDGINYIPVPYSSNESYISEYNKPMLSGGFLKVLSSDGAIDYFKSMNETDVNPQYVKIVFTVPGNRIATDNSSLLRTELFYGSVSAKELTGINVAIPKKEYTIFEDNFDTDFTKDAFNDYGTTRYSTWGVFGKNSADVSYGALSIENGSNERGIVGGITKALYTYDWKESNYYFDKDFGSEYKFTTKIKPKRFLTAASVATGGKSIEILSQNANSYVCSIVVEEDGYYINNGSTLTKAYSCTNDLEYHIYTFDIKDDEAMVYVDNELKFRFTMPTADNFYTGKNSNYKQDDIILKTVRGTGGAEYYDNNGGFFADYVKVTKNAEEIVKTDNLTDLSKLQSYSNFAITDCSLINGADTFHRTYGHTKYLAKTSYSVGSSSEAVYKADNNKTISDFDFTVGYKDNSAVIVSLELSKGGTSFTQIYSDKLTYTDWYGNTMFRRLYDAKAALEAYKLDNGFYPQYVKIKFYSSNSTTNPTVLLRTDMFEADCVKVNSSSIATSENTADLAVDLSSIGEESLNATVVAAIYDGNKLVDVKTECCYAARMAKSSMVFSDMTYNSSYIVKVFIWNEDGSMVPLNDGIAYRQ